jgi:hypothetical protein
VRTLSRRELNRATLARQLLLERASMDGVAAVEHLVGMQAQAPQSFYTGLWTRLKDFDAAALGAALEDQRLVRLPVMRTTIHLVTADDALGLRPLTQPVLDRVLSSNFGRRLVDVDRSALVDAAREFVELEPLIASELGRALVSRFPGSDPDALAQAARAWLPMVQVPPRGVWGRSGRPRQTPLDTWLGRTPKAASVDDVVRRYIAAFGPASVRDAQTWCGLTRLSEVFERLDLVRFTGEDGVELYDLPNALRPAADSPAPVRFLYDYDNLLLSHADRRRVLGEPGAVDYAAHGYGMDSNRQPSSLLVDGFVAGTWTASRNGLEVRGFRPFTDDEHAEITAEATALLAFLHPRATPAVVVR